MDYIKCLFPESLEKSATKTTAAVIAGSVVSYYLIHACFRLGVEQERGHTKIPIPKGRVPYFGHLFAMSGSPTIQLAEWQKEMGPAMYVHVGVKQWLIIGDPYLAHELMSVHGSVASNRPFRTFTNLFFAKNRGVVFSNPSDQWNKTRGTMLRLIGSKNSVKVRSAIDREVGALMETIQKSSDCNEEIDIMEHLKLVMMNVSLTIGVGRRATSIDDPLFNDLKAVNHEGLVQSSISRDLKTFLPVFSVLDYIFHRPKMAQLVRDMYTPLYGRLVKEALQTDVDCLVKEMNQLSHSDDLALMVSLTDILAAPNRLVSFAAAWNIVLLCCHPNSQKVLQEEIDKFTAVKKRLPTFDDRDNLPHLISWQKECIRYRPVSAMGLLHETTEDVHCRGYCIPKGTTIASNMRSIHMNPDIYEQPEKFVPDRFLHHLKPMSSSAQAPVLERDIYVFGWGRRICPGAYLAEVQIFTILVNVLARYTIEPPIDKDQVPVYPDLDNLDDDGIFVAPMDTIVRMRKRNDIVI